MTLEPFRMIDIDLLRLQGIQVAQLADVPMLSNGYGAFARPLGPALTAHQGETILMCAGIAKMAPQIGLCWALLSENARPHLRTLHKNVIRFLDSWPMRRLETSVVEGFEPGCRWVTMLGFQFEGRMRAYDESGRTHLRYAKIEG